MSMSTFIIGFKPPDDKWKKMKAIWDTCEIGGVDIPQEVMNFFNGMPPDDSGVEVKLENTSCCCEYQEDMRDGFEIDIAGFEIDIAKLPKDIKKIRFWNSW